MSASLGGAACPIGWAAELTRMSMPPRASVASATPWRTDSSDPVSITTGTMRRPVAAASSAAVASRSARVRAAMATSHPSAARARATALPMPLLPPVTSARFPSSCRSMAAG